MVLVSGLLFRVTLYMFGDKHDHASRCAYGSVRELNLFFSYYKNVNFYVFHDPLKHHTLAR